MFYNFPFFIDDVRKEYSVKVKGEYGETLKKRFLNDPRIVQLEFKHLKKGTHGSTKRLDVLVDTFAKWYLFVEDNYGKENAEQYLNDYLDNHEIEILCTQFIIGIKCEKPILLDNDIKIVPIEDLPHSREKENFLTGNSELISRSQVLIPRCAIVKKFTHAKLGVGNGEESKLDKWEEYLDLINHLKHIAFLMNALKGVSCLPYYHTQYSELTVPFGPFGGSGGGKPVLDSWGTGEVQIGSEIEDELNKVIRCFESYLKHQKDKFLIILNRICMSKRKGDFNDKILDLAIALEMLLLNDNKRDQLSLSFRLRGSWLLGSDSKERKEIYSELKKFYGYRSDVVHRGFIKEKDIVKMKINFGICLNYTERITRRIIKEGWPKWDDLVLGK